MQTQSLYEKDFYAWIHHNVDLLKQNKLAEIELDILIDELESMAKRDRRELSSHFIILIAHLLKWQFQPAHRSSSWRGSIREQRIQITKQLQESPSLKNHITDAIENAYPDALDLASNETGLAMIAFPNKCPYAIKDLLDKEFYPEKKV